MTADKSDYPYNVWYLIIDIQPYSTPVDVFSTLLILLITFEDQYLRAFQVDT